MEVVLTTEDIVTTVALMIKAEALLQLLGKWRRASRTRRRWSLVTMLHEGTPQGMDRIDVALAERKMRLVWIGQ